MATRPLPGQAKPCLCPPYTPAEATAFAEAFLQDTMRNLQCANVGEIVIGYAPPDADAWFAEQFPGRARILQRGTDSGKRLISVQEEAWKRRYQPCILIGTDSPDLPAHCLHSAFQALMPGPESADVVLGPTEEGNCYLIGLRWKEPRLFTDIPCGASQVLSQTLECAASLGLRVHLLPEWPVVATTADLEALRLRLRDAAPEICPATRRLLAEGFPALRSE